MRILIFQIEVTYRDSDVRYKDDEESVPSFWGSGNSGSNVDAPANNDFIDWGAARRECDEAQKIKWSKLPKLIKDFYQVDYCEISIRFIRMNLKI